MLEVRAALAGVCSSPGLVMAQGLPSAFSASAHSRVPAGADAGDTLPTTFLVQTLIYLPRPVSTFRLPHGGFF